MPNNSSSSEGTLRLADCFRNNSCIQYTFYGEKIYLRKYYIASVHCCSLCERSLNALSGKRNKDKFFNGTNRVEKKVGLPF